MQGKCLLCHQPACQKVILLNPNKFKTHDEWLSALNRQNSNDQYYIEYFCSRHLCNQFKVGEGEVDSMNE